MNAVKKRRSGLVNIPLNADTIVETKKKCEKKAQDKKEEFLKGPHPLALHPLPKEAAEELVVGHCDIFIDSASECSEILSVSMEKLAGLFVTDTPSESFVRNKSNKLTATGRPEELFGSERPEELFGSERPEELFGSERPEELFGSERPEELFGSNRPEDLFGSDRPEELFGSDRPEELFVSERPEELFVSERPDDLCLGNKQKELFVSDTTEEPFVNGRQEQLLVPGKSEELHVFLKNKAEGITLQRPKSTGILSRKTSRNEQTSEDSFNRRQSTSEIKVTFKPCSHHADSSDAYVDASSDKGVSRGVPDTLPVINNKPPRGHISKIHEYNGPRRRGSAIAKLNTDYRSPSETMGEKHGLSRKQSYGSLKSGTSSSEGKVTGSSSGSSGSASSPEGRLRKISTMSKASCVSQDINRQRKLTTTNYDPDLEKAAAYLHEGGKSFSRANTTLTPTKYGLKHLQMSYTETNLENNQSVLFLDLLKSSHQKNALFGESISTIERRLERQRDNPLLSTTFYENKMLRDPYRRNIKKPSARTVAQKKKERKDKIKKMTDEIHTGFVPTCLTMKILQRDEVEKMAKDCRYLRCSTAHLM